MRTLATIVMLFAIQAIGLTAAAQQSNIAVNQAGYYVYGPKTAVVVNDTTAGYFFVIADGTRDTVYKGLLGPMQSSLYSSCKTNIADFSALQLPGRYFIDVPGGGASYNFTITNKPLYDAGVALLKGYYYQRVSMPLEEKYAGKWHRPAGHPDDKVLVHPSAATGKRPAGTVISTPGGWYDAGDYNKYIVNSGISTGTLLSAYEDFRTYFDTLKTNIPESSNRVPDILDEILYNVRWMLTMQDHNDGGVYNKCTNAAFDSMVMPGITKLPRYVVAKGAAAGLDFAAVMAQTARITKRFSKVLPGLSDSCLHAAEYAWQWALQHPDMAYDQNAINKLYTPKITTGAYGDGHFSDEWFWAACELFITTGKQQYFDTVEAGMHVPFSIPSWSSVHALGYYTLIRNENSIPHKTPVDVSSVKRRLIEFADSLTAGGNKAFATVMGQSRRDFIWGSNSVAANQGVALINAYLISGNKKYINAALSNIDYLFGRNATGYCFVTGFGTKSTMHPHHRQSISDGIAEPVPGLLAGGPNPGRQDGTKYAFAEPETAYSDASGAYASNEIAINWNAPAVYLVNAVEALQYKTGYSKK
ncbi:MAG TPA: glycoside hydrolase family 9 protein [Chitinophagaceae bacterium]|nr:glycoside hydrolase family 9 protein [Chitinophagaceae bacterium]